MCVCVDTYKELLRILAFKNSDPPPPQITTFVSLLYVLLEFLYVNTSKY